MTEPTETRRQQKRREVTECYPLLAWHFGIGPSEAATMPRWLKQAYLDAIPKLIADRQLRALEASAYPHMEERDQKAVQKQWRDMLGVAAETAHAPQSLEELRILTAASGVGMVIEPKKKPEDQQAPAGETK